MLGLAEIAALVTATREAVDLFDRFSGQIKSVLLKRPKENEGADDRWRYKISTQGDSIVVTQDGRRIQTISGQELATKLSASDLALVQTFERKMEDHFRVWKRVYEAKDSSPDALVNAKTDEQLAQLIRKMRAELVGILNFLQRIGVNLDDHYMHIRYLIEQEN